MGTPATTTLGMKPAEMKEIGSIIYHLLKDAKGEILDKSGEPSKSKAVVPPASLHHAQKNVAEIMQRFPLYPELVID
jgi:glycine hydroxymethyltransferase